MAVAAGRLTERIRLQRRATGINDSGSERREWDDIGTVYAEAAPVTGRESFAGQQRFAEVDVVFTVRYRADLTPLHRILWREREYDVVAVLPLPGGRPDRLEIHATARAE